MSLDDALPRDLAALIARRGVPLAGADEITTLPSPDTPRRSFRLRFEDGIVLKGRIVNDAATAASLKEILDRIDSRLFPRAIAVHGAALLEPWVEGRTLQDAGWSDRDAQDAGAVLGALHATATPSGRWGPRVQPALPQVERLHAMLQRLESASALDGAETERLSRSAVDAAPDRAEHGFIHRDLCPENLLRSADRQLWSIDNAILTFGPLEHDLGRTWYRWQMTREQRERFLEGYGRHRSTAAWHAHAVFWIVFTLADAACRRLDLRLANPEAPLERLRAMSEGM